MTLSAYLNNDWVDLSSDIDYSSDIQLTDRIDDAFVSGNVKVWLDRADPIPPYTPFLVNGGYMVGTSEVTKYLAESNTYVHDISLLEASAFLKCIIIGVKIYSVESPTWSTDVEKFISLIRLANAYYSDYTFVIFQSGVNPVSYLSTRITTKKTYTFDAKSTLFDCLNQICLENNKKIRVSFSQLNPTTFYITLEDVPRLSAYTIVSNYVTLDKSSQDAENYGRFLETYASNVVDRTTLTKVEFLEPRSADIALNSDNASLFLPTKIERIKRFGVYQTDVIKFIVKGIDSYWNDASGRFGYQRTYGDIATNDFTMVGSTMHYVFDELYDNYLKDFFPFVTKTFFYNNAYSTPYAANTITIDIPTTCKGKFPMNCVEEKSEWELRTPQNQTKCLVYTTGDNVISNMNATYKNDLWNAIFNQASYNFLHYYDETEHTFYDEIDVNAPLEIYLYEGISQNTDLFSYLYWVEYYAITNPIIRDDKGDSSIAPISRSYGNSANFIDFDKLIPNMAIANNTLGQVEKVIQLDLSNQSTLPKSGQPTTYDSKQWFISNVVFEYGCNNTIATLTLVKDYQKKADAIGVDSQSEFTDNPLRNITERSIMLNATYSNLSDLLDEPLYMSFAFFDMENTLIPNDNNGNVAWTLYKRCSVQATDSAILLYVEMLDQIVFDNGLGAGYVGYTEQFPYVYTTNSAETSAVDISIGTLTPNTIGNSMKMPIGDNATFQAKTGLSFNGIRLDKDAREKLTFSVKITQA